MDLEKLSKSSIVSTSSITDSLLRHSQQINSGVISNQQLTYAQTTANMNSAVYNSASSILLNNK